MPDSHGLAARLEAVTEPAERVTLAREALALGLPQARSENWKYTRTQGLDALPWSPAAGLAESDTRTLLAELEQRLPLDGPRLVWANGKFQAELSRLDGLPEGLEFSLIDRAGEQELLRRRKNRALPEERHPLDTVNAALFNTGFQLVLQAGVRCEKPLAVIHLQGTASVAGTVQCRNLIRLDEGAELTLLECNVGHAPGSTATHTSDWTLAKGARASHVRVQAVRGEAFRISHQFVELAGDAAFDGTTISLAGETIRNESLVRLNGPGASAALAGLGLLDGKRHLDSHTWLDHAVPDCNSHQLFKHVLDQGSRAVFTGHILVRQDAQHTDAIQNSKSLLLSDEARANTRPQLEIHADDVKCTHGATVGHLEEEGLFYLRSRGIDGDMARRLLVRGFAQDVVDQVTHPDLQAPLGDWVQRHFESDER
ncbi:MAG: Fe-S cluster assembly protein SufD [Candidatus Delongbacteria bacterium]|nr:Fe-S cluster assembly protein SufD [Candidatus Cloacimonadota bacterium]MCB9475150.1 Fe-S cluster assembly protein SufD [Candidatus Delongbacteria bacterium]